MIFLSVTLAIASIGMQTAPSKQEFSTQNADIPPEVFYYRHHSVDERRPYHIPPIYVQNRDYIPNYVHGDAKTFGWSGNLFINKTSPNHTTYARLHVTYEFQNQYTDEQKDPRDPVRYTSKYGPIGDVSYLIYNSQQDITTSTLIHGLRITLTTKSNGMALIGYHKLYPEPAFGILRYAAAVLLGNPYHKPVTSTQTLRTIPFQTYKLHTSGDTAYRLTTFLNMYNIPVSANYKEGVLTWSINNNSFTVPLASKYYWINGTMYESETYSVIHDGSFYVDKDIISFCLDALEK